MAKKVKNRKPSKGKSASAKNSQTANPKKAPSKTGPQGFGGITKIPLAAVFFESHEVFGGGEGGY